MKDSLPKQIQKDIRFLLSFVPAMDPDDVDAGLAPMFYVTGTYKGDLELADEVKNICDRYDIHNEDIDDDEDLTEEY